MPCDISQELVYSLVQIWMQVCMITHTKKKISVFHLSLFTHNPITDLKALICRRKKIKVFKYHCLNHKINVFKYHCITFPSVDDYL